VERPYFLELITPDNGPAMHKVFRLSDGCSYLTSKHVFQGRMGFQLNVTDCISLTQTVRARGVRKAVGIRRGAISSDMKVSFQAARSIG
jgi:hypothetical protein